MTTITKKELTAAVRHQFPKISALCLSNILDAFHDATRQFVVEGHQVQCKGFGVFFPAMRKEKIGRNPKNPVKEMIIPACRVVRFAPSIKFEEQMKEG